MPSKEESRMLKEIAQNYGTIINLEEAPSVLAEILRNYGRRFAGGTTADGPDGGIGSTSVSASVGGVQTTKGDEQQPALGDVMRGILNLQRTVSGLESQLKQILRPDRLASSVNFKSAARRK